MMKGTVAVPSPAPVDRPLGAQPWLALGAATLGFLLDAMDVMLFVFAMPTLRAEFGLTNQQTGLAMAATQLSSAAGGVLAGILADRLGRRRTLIYTILLYSFGSGGTALAQGLGGLIAWRAVVGLGLGGEWSAGAVLVAETWPARHRGKAIAFMQSGWALGYIAAAGLAAWILPRYGWRVLFLTGMLPALFTILVRRYVAEPEVWTQQAAPADPRALFRPPLLRSTVLATTLATVVLFAYWGLFTWLPGFLAAPTAQGGAGLGLVGSFGYVVSVQAGAYVGYLTFGLIADAIGRRPAFAGYVVLAALIVPVYGLLPRWAGSAAGTGLLVLGPLVGACGTGFFALFGAMLAELYPTSVRGAGQGFAYNVGRGLSALAPYAVGAAADRQGFGAALGLTSLFFLAAAALVFTLPETRGQELRDAAQ